MTLSGLESGSVAELIAHYLATSEQLANRVENALRIAGQAEIEAILAERADVEVTCEFCNRRYVCRAAAARALFAPETSRMQH